MDGSNGKIVELLERIAGGQEETREEMREMREEMRGLRTEMRHGFEQVSSRIDHIVTFLGSYHADHEQRIRTLEERVLGKGKA